HAVAPLRAKQATHARHRSGRVVVTLADRDETGVPQMLVGVEPARRCCVPVAFILSEHFDRRAAQIFHLMLLSRAAETGRSSSWDGSITSASSGAGARQPSPRCRAVRRNGAWAVRFQPQTYGLARR